MLKLFKHFIAKKSSAKSKPVSNLTDKDEASLAVQAAEKQKISEVLMLDSNQKSGSEQIANADIAQKQEGANKAALPKTAYLLKTNKIWFNLFGRSTIDEALFNELEEQLILSDAGVSATQELLTALRMQIKNQRLTTGTQVKQALRELLIMHLAPLERNLEIDNTSSPYVLMMVGSNGVGKTTSIAKLAQHFQHQGKSVLFAAGDTFRAAAREQLAIWSERCKVPIIAQEGGDPAAVMFDAVQAAHHRKIDLLIADTAGRLSTQVHLMEELKKVKRVLGKALPCAPHEVLLVIDANTGQNALMQVQKFHQALGLTGLIVTKLDGSAKGGMIIAMAYQCPVPIYFIGVGEQLEDLQPFSAQNFAYALLPEEE